MTDVLKQSALDRLSRYFLVLEIPPQINGLVGAREVTFRMRHPDIRRGNFMVQITKRISTTKSDGRLPESILQKEGDDMAERLMDLVLSDMSKTHDMRQSFIKRLKFLFKPR